MSTLNVDDQQGRWAIPGRVTWRSGNSGMPCLTIASAASEAELYLQGAHLTRFKRLDEPAVLFTSAQSRFQPGQPIRGGVPIIFPWFGNREGSPAHGLARTAPWRVIETSASLAGFTQVRLACDAASHEAVPFSLVFVVSVGESLRMELITTNRSADAPFKFEDCLHTYFTVGAIESARVAGLRGVRYLDKTDAFAEKEERQDAIAIVSETDRVYQDTVATVEILDPVLKRRIRIAKTGSRSTVLWNHWIAKAKQLSDFGDEEYRGMVCVESGNVGRDAISLPPGASHSLGVEVTVVSADPNPRS
ncbi:MAG: D-hexose-6-phosphate mutarotase [Verrucomicrobia bacterium]|nr:D-hexose-6-phosphate mutarotase [Verrucomicrobiota bacterium]